MEKRHQGDALHALVRKSKVKGKDLASIFDIHPSYLSRLNRYEELPEPIIEKATVYFGVPRSYFDSSPEHGTDEKAAEPSRMSVLIDAVSPSQKEFSELTGISEPTLSQVISGKRNLTVSIAVKIKEKFPNVNIDWLIRGEGDMFKTPPPEKTNGAVLDDCAKVRADNADLRERLLNATTELIRVQSELIEAQRKIIGLQEGKT